MVSLPRLHPKTPITLTLEPLTPSSFAPFGTVIAAPISSDLTAIPSSLPPASYPTHQPPPQFANQQTALKTSPISPLINNYPPLSSSSAKGNTTTISSSSGTGLMSIFSCFPRLNIQQSGSRATLPIPILERHPYTTQTFCPFNFSLPSKQHSSSSSSDTKTYFLVIVAPTLSSPTSSPSNPPSLPHLRAFFSPVAIDGPSPVGLAVTYNPGTWHAPMIVVGSRRVDFLVTQHANGIADDDCQEVLIGGGEDDMSKGRNVVQVDLTGLKIGGVASRTTGSKAKL